MEDIRSRLLAAEVKPSLIVTFKETDSTNERARRFPELPTDAEVTEAGGYADTAVFIAERQTGGRGRLGRSFISPEGGLYLSLRIRLTEPLINAVNVTPFAAVAAARAIERLTGADARIKWVNDLYIGDRKLAGILTESIPEECGDGYCTLVIGIGINVCRAEMPTDVSKIATSLEAEGFCVDRAELACELIGELLSGIRDRDECILEEYRDRQMLIGKRVTVTRGDESYDATAIGITNGYGLLVELTDGERRELTSGEVSCRPI